MNKRILVIVTDQAMKRQLHSTLLKYKTLSNRVLDEVVISTYWDDVRVHRYENIVFVKPYPEGPSIQLSFSIRAKERCLLADGRVHHQYVRSAGDIVYLGIFIRDLLEQ